MTYAFLDDCAHENDKLVAIGGAAAWYWACGLMYCRRKEASRRAKGLRVDFIPESASLSLYGDPLAAEHVKAILRVKLWDLVEGGYMVHDYHKVYGKRATDPEPPADDQQNQQRQLSPSQLAARAAGGRARAATASRGPAGKLGPPATSTSNGPAALTSSGSRSLGSDSGSAGSGSGSLAETTTTKDLTGTQQPAEPVTDVVVVGRSTDPADPGRETMCPTDLVARLEANGTVRLLGEKLASPAESIRAALRAFEGYWTIGKGAGQRRTGWAGKARQWVVDQAAKPGGLPAPGAVAHAALAGDDRGGGIGLTPDEMARLATLGRAV